MSECCKTGFKWEGKPVGKESKLANLNTYVTGSNKEAAVLIVHDVFGYTLNNARLLADHYAKEADVTVFLPDLYILPHARKRRGQILTQLNSIASTER